MAPRFTAHFALILAAAAAFTFTACTNDRHGVFVGGAVAAPTAVVFSVGLTPSNLTLFSLSRAGCPVTQPFMTNVSLVLGPLPPSDFFFNQLTLAFIDGVGHRSTLFFGPTDLNLMFGDRRIRAGTHRVFAFSPQFGCGISRPRSMEAIVGIIDGTGLLRESTATGTFQ